MNEPSIQRKIRSIRSTINMAVNLLAALESELNVETVKPKKKPSFIKHLEDVEASGKKWAKPAELRKQPIKKTA